MPLMPHEPRYYTEEVDMTPNVPDWVKAIAADAAKIPKIPVAAKVEEMYFVVVGKEDPDEPGYHSVDFGVYDKQKLIAAIEKGELKPPFSDRAPDFNEWGLFLGTFIIKGQIIVPRVKTVIECVLP